MCNKIMTKIPFLHFGNTLVIHPHYILHPDLGCSFAEIVGLFPLSVRTFSRYWPVLLWWHLCGLLCRSGSFQDLRWGSSAVASGFYDLGWLTMVDHG